MREDFTIFTDGGSRGNPGPAAIGVVVKKNGRVVKEIAKRIGEATNNVAEYVAVIEALRYVATINSQRQPLSFYLDSLLVVNQLMGTFKVKDAKLRNFLFEIRTLEQEVGGEVKYFLVPREQNQHADSLVNYALDK